MKTHEVKVWPLPFAATVAGDKNWEFRVNDRNYQIGDEFLGREWEPHQQSYTGRSYTRQITYVLRDGFGLPDGYVVLSLAVPGVAELRARAFAQAAEIARDHGAAGSAVVVALLELKAKQVLEVPA